MMFCCCKKEENETFPSSTAQWRLGSKTSVEILERERKPGEQGS